MAGSSSALQIKANYERLLKALNAPEPTADPRFRTNPDRMMNRETLIEALTAHLRQRDTAEWIAELEKTGMPVGPILSLPEVLSHPQTLAREMLVETEHSRIGKTKSLGLPIKFSETPGEVRRAAPVLGEHTREVLQAAGIQGRRSRNCCRKGR
jgi:crotonobetainyl-CoA:carnitine CoA-transferase CaiB-like acyl-CoA transferase